jgi:hypothetical protein
LGEKRGPTGLGSENCFAALFRDCKSYSFVTLACLSISMNPPEGFAFLSPVCDSLIDWISMTAGGEVGGLPSCCWSQMFFAFFCVLLGRVRGRREAELGGVEADVALFGKAPSLFLGGHCRDLENLNLVELGKVVL